MEIMESILADLTAYARNYTFKQGMYDLDDHWVIHKSMFVPKFMLDEVWIDEEIDICLKKFKGLAVYDEEAGNLIIFKLS